MMSSRLRKKMTTAFMGLLLAILPLVQSLAGGSAAAAAVANEWADIGAGGGFSEVCALTVDRKGTVYAGDCSTGKVKMLQNGVWTDLTGTEPFDYPTGIAVDSQGHVYVADEGSGKLKQYANGS